MKKYYTRACNFYYGSESKLRVKKKLSLPLNGNSLISFDCIELINRKSKKIINVKMSNMNIKIKVNFLRGVKKINNSQWIEKSKFSKYTLPSFTKRIYKSIQNQI